MSEFSVRIVSWNDAAEPLSAVRRAVFIEEQGVPEVLEWDGEDGAALHILATDSKGHPIGTGRLLIHDTVAHIGRMAVLRNWRGQGVGRSIMAALLKEVERRRLAGALLNAQTYAVPFYECFGFAREGKEFLDAGIPHYRMTLGTAHPNSK